ncbi:hypothetical protein [Larkinella humicola]|uniref:DinB family protein n=1 Tax=Larkinella humicola TaxID=2607654 RepID=A0A5N1JES3_9BACT|nr:hypothetical protein [Larkinella humicola]KAA9349606.1 hypothetical protein F0P93_19270 [Larkinella humicola]
MIIAVINLKKTVTAYHRLNTHQPDFTANLQQALTEVVGKLPALGWLVGEVAVLRYALLGPWLKPEVKPDQSAYTLYRESGVTALGITLLVVGGVETLVIHLLYGQHAERGKETILDIVRYYAGHDLNHLAQIEAILKG